MRKISKILVIEDDNDLREIAVKMLQLAGYAVSGTKSRDEAVAIINRTPEITTLLLDITMPGMSIDQFLSKIGDKLSMIHIIFSSGQPDEAVERFLEERETFSFLPKPYGLHELKAVLQNI